MYLLRHGIAEDHAPSANGGFDDSQRALTKEGIKKTGKVIARLGQTGIKVSRILTSPLLRAQQTAELLNKAFPAPVLLLEELSPTYTPIELLSALQNLPHEDNTCLVGHEPLLSTFTSLLISGSPACSIDLKKAGFIGLSFQKLRAHHATLTHLIPPKILI